MTKKLFPKIISFVSNKRNIVIAAIFLIFVFLRFYEFEKLNPFGWDQVDNAWAAKNILVDNKYPLVGMVAKGNSGFYIGPAYYYFISFFYYLTRLDPIASGLIAGITSIFSFFTIYHIAKKLFSYEVAVFALIINTFSIYSISFDRVQWPVNFIAPISLIILFALYKVMQGRAAYLVLLSITLGFSFHVHFTAIFFPICIVLSMPFIKWNKKFITYIPVSIFLFILWLLPNVFYELTSKGSSSRNMTSYLRANYHGLHMTRVLQLAQDAFIELEGIFYFKFIKFIKFLVLPLFFVVYFLQKKDFDRFKLLYLFGLWFVVPWIIFSVYKGEISNYYFSSTRYVGILAIAYVLYWLFSFKNLFAKTIIVIFITIYAYYNLLAFNDYKNDNIFDFKKIVLEKVKNRQAVSFMQGNPESYLYYIYTR